MKKNIKKVPSITKKIAPKNPLPKKTPKIVKKEEKPIDKVEWIECCNCNRIPYFRIKIIETQLFIFLKCKCHKTMFPRTITINELFGYYRARAKKEQQCSTHIGEKSELYCTICEEWICMKSKMRHSLHFLTNIKLIPPINPEKKSLAMSKELEKHVEDILNKSSIIMETNKNIKTFII